MVANTTTTRPAVSDQEASAFYANKGGLSGRPLKALSLEAVRDMYHLTKGKVSRRARTAEAEPGPEREIDTMFPASASCLCQRTDIPPS